MPDTILIIDDEEPIREALSGILSDEGFTPIGTGSAEEGLELLSQENVDLVLLDIWMPGMDGLQALPKIRKNYGLPVIMISGHGTIETAVQATRDGAFDFIEKPLSYDKVILSVNKGLHVARLERENKLLKENSPHRSELTGKSVQIEHLREQIQRVAPTDASVLILGDHGTGKELVAQAIHRRSSRAQLPMIEVNCAAIPEELIESELFGHVKGAFTGATSTKPGKFDQADGSTLFLDEIGDMSLKSQAKVLRILQEQRFERVGGTKTVRVDVRILAATNKDLEEEIKEGRFRADLFYRLSVVPLHLPSLNDRREDIPLLVADFLQDMQQKGLGQKKMAREAMNMLITHSWSGNVRELRNMVERLVIMSPGNEIRAEDAALFLGAAGPQTSPSTSLSNNYSILDYKEARRQFEHDYLKEKLQENNGNVSKTAEQIGMERSHLHKKVKALNIALEK